MAEAELSIEDYIDWQCALVTHYLDNTRPAILLREQLKRDGVTDRVAIRRMFQDMIPPQLPPPIRRPRTDPFLEERRRDGDPDSAEYFATVARRAEERAQRREAEFRARGTRTAEARALATRQVATKKAGMHREMILPRDTSEIQERLSTFTQDDIVNLVREIVAGNSPDRLFLGLVRDWEIDFLESLKYPYDHTLAERLAAVLPDGFVIPNSKFKKYMSKNLFVNLGDKDLMSQTIVDLCIDGELYQFWNHQRYVLTNFLLFLRTTSVFDYIFLQTRLENCYDEYKIEDDDFQAMLHELSRIGILIPEEDGPADLDLQENIKRHFLAQDWGMCLQNISVTQVEQVPVVAYNLYEAFRDEEFLYQLRTVHRELTRGSFAVLQKMFHMCPPVFLLLAKTETYVIYNRDLMQRIYQLYVNIQTLLLTNARYNPLIPSLHETRLVAEALRALPLPLHITYVPCNRVLKYLPQRMEAIVVWFRSFEMSEENLVKYNANCPYLVTDTVFARLVTQGRRLQRT